MEGIVLVCAPLLFFSKTDEKFFLRWIKKIKSITKIAISADKLSLNIASDDIPDNDLDELIALFARYSFDSNQLEMFVNEYNKDFFPRVDGVGAESYHKVYPRRDKEKITRSEVNLKCTPLRFYTKNDENVMFGLIEKIKSITHCYGIGQTLYLVVDRERLSGEDMANLKALFVRYRYDQKQLSKINKKVSK